MLQPAHQSNGRRDSDKKPAALEARSNGAPFEIGGEPLGPETLWKGALQALHPRSHLKVAFAPEALDRVAQASALLDKLVASEEPVYGVNTGFGFFANVVIPPERIVALQKNIVRSHCCGVGDLLPRDIVMAMWLIGLNTICRGHSGVRVQTLHTITRVLEAGILGEVPSQGSVGASGDLAPGAHTVLTLLGEGRCTMPVGDRIETMPAGDALARIGVAPLELGPKEGLSLINGTHLSTALAVKAWYEGQYLLKVANLAAAMTIEALGGDRKGCAELVTRAHGHPGTIACGREVSAWLGPSSQLSAHHAESHWIQDPYSLRCVPQVHGAVWDELQTSTKTLEYEINAVTDNPLLFPEEHAVCYGGNFHAIYPARVSDRLASAFATLANISERRISQTMLAPRKHLPTFLVNDGGVNSGYMMAHVSAAALVSEAKSQCFPASVDSIPTNVTQEDHVSMGPIAGVKANRVADMLRRVLAIELLTAAQGLYLMRPLKSSPRLEEAYQRIRELVPPLDEDRALTDDIETVVAAIRDHKILPEPGPNANGGANGRNGASHRNGHS
jgi:histidine ammonia-lyase